MFHILVMEILILKKYILLTFQNTNQKFVKQNFFLMITNEEGRLYISATKLSALLRKVTSTHDDDFHCLNCLHLLRTKNKLESH